MTVNEKNYQWSGSLSKRTKTDYIVLHHAAAAMCTADDIHRWHLNNGWAGIGYHLFVRKNGEIYRGRPIDTVGAHCLNYNSRSIGICAEGAYDSTDTSMPAAQKAALMWLVAELRKVYKTAKVVQHKELTATSCPGRYFPFEEILKGEAANPPADIPSDWAEAAWDWVRGAGITDGTNPQGAITREQVAVMLYRFAARAGLL